jgi:threonyl-tRNA synthetase
MNDHRRMGRELGIFGSDELIGSGLPYWLPDGAVVRHELEDFVRRMELGRGYRHVYSPVLGKRELYEISGHWEHYRGEMFPPLDMGGDQLVLRPSLCPHHALIFRSRQRSYRELPLRLAELGGMYRSELSGVLGGLARVRAINLNDAHVFCAEEQVEAEVGLVLEMISEAYAAMSLQPSRYRLSLKPDGRDADSDVLERALRAAGVPYEAQEGEAAFYGPKIDVQVADGAGREFTVSTVQVDRHQPRRFGLEFVGADGGRHRPVMVHRSVIGSMERTVALLIEKHGGAFPAWLAPVQAVVLPVGEEQAAAAEALAGELRSHGVRAEMAGPELGSLGARIARNRLVPSQLVIGAAELARDEVAVRLRDGQRLPAMPRARAVTLVRAR